MKPFPPNPTAHAPAPRAGRALGVAMLLAITALSGCIYRPLYGAGSYSPQGSGETSSYALQQIYVPDVDTRVAQQVRNRLIFLLEGGHGGAESAYQLLLRVTAVNSAFAASRELRDNTAGAITVTARYDLIDNRTHQPIAKGSRTASSSYDRTTQNFANDRALRDAENRASHEVAEELRLALAADLSRMQAR